jgi:hypothetical protein
LIGPRWATAQGAAVVLASRSPLAAALRNPDLCTLTNRNAAGGLATASERVVATVDRRPTGMRVVRRKLFVYPIKIENAVDLPDQMIRRHHLVEIKRVEVLASSSRSGETMPSTDTPYELVPVNRDAEQAGAIGGKADIP